MKSINQKLWLLGLALAVSLLWSITAKADASLPFYATSSAKPNVLLIIDTSGSMAWCVECSDSCCGWNASNKAYRNCSDNRSICGYNACPNGGAVINCSQSSANRRIDIVRRALTGSGKNPVYYTVGSNNYKTYMGSPSGNLLVWNDVFNADALVDILLVHESSTVSGTYAMVSRDYYNSHRIEPYYEGFYFVFKDARDLQFGNATTKAEVEAATYSLDRLLLDYSADFVANFGDYDISGDALVNTPRTLWQADYITGELFRDAFLDNYGLQENFVVARVKRYTNCYQIYVSGKLTWRPCYKPAPFPSLPNPDPTLDTASTVKTFVIEGSTDYNYSVNNPTNTNIIAMNNSKMYLADFLTYVRDRVGAVPSTGYNSYCLAETGVQICGDGLLSGCSADGYQTPARTIHTLCADGSASAKLIHTAANPWTEQEIVNKMQAAIPLVGAVNAWTTADGTAGPEFINETAATRKDILVREGLDYGLSSAQQKYNPWNRSLSSACFDTKYFCDFFGYVDSLGNHIWTGLPYLQLSTETKGIMDNYDARYGLMIYDSNGSDSDFGQEGANLIYNLSEGSTNNIYLQEIIAQADQNMDGKVANCTTGPSPCSTWNINLLNSPSGATPIVPSLRDAITYLYYHYFGDQPNAAWRNDTTTNTTPSMLNIWSSTYITKYNMTNYNGHILLNDPYFYYHCRKNNVVFLTDGGQTQGIPWPGTYNEVNTTAELTTVENAMKVYIDYMVNPSTIPGRGSYSQGTWDQTKLFLIGLSLGSSYRTGADTYAPDMLNYLAQQSKLNASDEFTYPLYPGSESELNQAFSQIMDKIMQGVYMRSAPTFSVSMNYGAAGYFEILPSIDYLWQGHFVYVDLAPMKELSSGGTVTIPTSVDAASLLNNRTSPPREIFTSYLDTTPDPDRWKRREFTSANSTYLDSAIFSAWPTKLSGYDQNGDSVLTDADTKKVIDFIRGDNNPTYNDGKNTPRSHKLGAIYHSTPIAYGPPPKDALKGVVKYQTFATTFAAAPEMAYVGALDGMLHAFFFQDPDGTSGTRSVMEEAFAYVPNFVLPELYQLRNGSQQITVDGDPNLGVANIKMNPFPSPAPLYCDTTKGRCWETVLFSGLRDGGPAYFALNITDVSLASGSTQPKIQPLWEFTDGDEIGKIDSILGNSWSLPFIDEALYQPASASTIDSRLILVFGGGRSPSHTSYQGSWLYILNADDGTTSVKEPLLVPSLNQRCNVAPGELVTTLNDCNTVEGGNPVTNYNQVPGDVKIQDVTNDGYPDWIYFGDVQGRIWKANIHNPDPDKWGICLFFDTGDKGYDNLSDPKSTCSGDLRQYTSTSQPSCANPNKRRQIWYRPAVGPSPDNKSWLVYVGTGTIEDSSQAQDPNQINWVFALQDNDTPSGCHYASMWKGKIGANSGWPIKFAPGEKLISPPIFMPAYVYKAEIGFMTYNPSISSNVCKPGTTYKWQVDYDTGQGAIATQTGGVVRFIEEPGLAGKPAILGSNILTLDPVTGQFTGEKPAYNPYTGTFFWWVK